MSVWRLPMTAIGLSAMAIMPFTELSPLVLSWRLSRTVSQRWSRIFAQGVKWNFCLTAGNDSARESGEVHEEESTPEPLTGLQG